MGEILGRLLNKRRLALVTAKIIGRPVVISAWRVARDLHANTGEVVVVAADFTDCSRFTRTVGGHRAATGHPEEAGGEQETGDQFHSW